jgi:valyl-tRNA synthetase
MAMEKTFNAQEAEDRLYQAWDKAGAFAAGANAKEGADPFCIMIPPPNVTGSLHMGHAFNNTLQDILTRWHRMRGFDTLWQPGTDHAGIATQMVTEREMAANGEETRAEMGREKFFERVWQQKVKSRGTIIGQLKRLGASCDWSREAFTMGGAAGDPEKGSGPNFHDAVIKVFVDLYNKGLIYRGKRLVNWDPHFETAISDLEVENVEVSGHMWHFKYPLAGGATYTYVEKDEDGNIVLEEERDYISIATTRPETMLGDGAVAVHPDDARYAPIVGKLCEIPVGPKEHRRLIPIITDDYPDPDFGSGAVKITGAHDFNDYEVAKRGGIPMYRLMDTKGVMRADGAAYADEAAKAQAIVDGKDFTEAEVDAINLVPDAYRGLDRFEARKKVVADITAEGNAVMIPNPEFEALDEFTRVGIESEIPLVEAKPIMQPFGDRSKVVIEPMLTDQWFVDSAKIAGPAMQSVREGRVKIMPESGEKIFFHWLDNIEPWCISRQLWWGHQIPVWYGPNRRFVELDGTKTLVHDFDTPLIICAENFEQAEQKARNHYQKSDVPDPEFIKEVGSLEDAVNGSVAPQACLVRDPDVLDTWFSSGLWPFGTLGWPNDDPAMRYFPGDVLITGQDILFFWVARMMMMSEAVMECEPFHTVYLHQLLRDAKGEKMSKTRGNVMDPLDMIDIYGADALRFSNAAMAALGGVLKISEDRIKGYRNFGTKLWNAFSFANHYKIANAGDTGRPEAQQTLNKWIIGETGKIREAVDAALTAYRFNDAADALYAFVWGKVCDWYLEFSKPILQGDDYTARTETEQTLRWVLDQCLILLHPIMPFITEELWSLADNRTKMLVHADWPTYGSELLDADADREMNWVIELIENIRSARAQSNVPAGARVPLLLKGLEPRAQVALDKNKALVMRLARIDTLDHVDTFPKATLTIPMVGGSFGIPLAELLDAASEITRLETALQKLGKEVSGLRGRLGNSKFIASAPEDVVRAAQENLVRCENEEAQIKAAIARWQEFS